MTARFAHTNLVARSYPTLASFYERVFGCTPVPPERNLSGASIEQATSLAGARIRGMHLRLPGHGPDGPTLEIFEYSPSLPSGGTAIHRAGFGHIAFVVDDVQAARRAMIEAGGGEVGKVVEVEVPGAGRLTFAYLTDPEGNIVEVQRWG